MKEDHNKETDALSKKLFKEAGLQSPDSNFEFKIMQQINSLSVPSVISYKAPFSKMVIPIAIILFAGSILGIFFFGDQSSVSLFDKIPTMNLDYFQLPTVQLPQSVVFGMLALTVLLFAQVPILKSLFKNRWN